MKIYLSDLRSVPVPGRQDGYCVMGMRAFADRHRLNVREFAHHGVDADVLMATGDAMAIRLVEYVRKTRGEDG